MSLLSKRNLLVGVLTFILGIGAFAAIWGMPKFLKPNTTTKSQVAAYLLDERGAVNGLLLTSGDQLHFSPQTGEAVAAQIKVGDEVTATGHAGSKSNYGREVRVEQISANGRTIIEAESGPKHPHEPRDKRGPKGHDERPAPPDASAPAEAKTESNVAPGSDAGDALQTGNAQPAPPEIFKATGTVKAHLVNGHGDVDGLILSSGEQVRFSPKVGKLVIAAEQGADTPVSVEGTAVSNERGTVIRPTLITVGNQTIALGR
ncbi:MAG: hypothetical protein QOH25_2673 [Acidobacteriota bacterium]|jgi:hypothetical protein|nr:hypothetical protein [Acidobacteriota bacterium]